MLIWNGILVYIEKYQVMIVYSPLSTLCKNSVPIMWSYGGLSATNKVDGTRVLEAAEEQFY